MYTDDNIQITVFYLPVCDNRITETALKSDTLQSLLQQAAEIFNDKQ